MSDAISADGKQLSWKFPPTFWFANAAELCERAAFYGMFITLFRYLNTDVGFTDVWTGGVVGAFSGGIYLLPTFMGIMADKIGFKRALLVAFALLTGGYALLGAFQIKWTALVALFLIMCGGAIIKPVISGTVAKCSDSDHRARAMSIFYMVVNIGAFSGKGLAAELNERLGLQYINFYAAAMTFFALVLVALLYKNVDTAGQGKTLREALRGLWKVMRNFRFLSLILIIAGFWLIQGQLYGAMPTFIERMLGKGYRPEWLANINPLTVVILVVPITHVIRKFQPVNAIGIGLFIIPLTALVIALATPLEKVTGRSVDLSLFSVHPLILMVAIGIALQGLAECFLSPKFLEYASKQAPPGEIGLYLGYQHLTTFVAWLVGMVAAGVLLNAYCPDPRKLDATQRHEWRLATDPKYQFSLDEEKYAGLDEDVAIADAITKALQNRNLDLPTHALLREIEGKAAWREDPERAWRIEEQIMTIREVWTTSQPGWLVRGTPDLLQVTPDGPRWADESGVAPGSFELPGTLEVEFAGDAPVTAALRAALADQGYPLPEDTAMRKERVDDAHGGTIQWLIVVPHYSIVEAKLETSPEARGQGRDSARRDVLVYGTIARTPQETPSLPSAYDRASYIWYAFAGVGCLAFLALIVFKNVTGAIDRRRGSDTVSA